MTQNVSLDMPTYSLGLVMTLVEKKHLPVECVSSVYYNGTRYIAEITFLMYLSSPENVSLIPHIRAMSYTRTL